jgi:glutamine amidotransferase
VKTVTLIDSPVANVANIARALRQAGAAVEITRDAGAVRSARNLVLPGVGSFRAAMTWLIETGLDRALRVAVAARTPLLGICVGHQALFESSDEMGSTAGLSLLPGAVRRLATALPVPQIGWNRVHFGASAMFDGIEQETPFYFVNSFAAVGVDAEIASAEYGGPFTAAVQRENVWGVQFHPEKSSAAGLRVLANFIRA